MARSLNKVLLIGNLTRDPELRYTPAGTAVCSFGIATNRQWATDSGEKKEDVEFHRLVAWNKLAEICAQLLKKGRKVYIEGRLQTRNWTGQDGSQRTTTEIVVTDMILLDSKREGESLEEFDIPTHPEEPSAPLEETVDVQKEEEGAKDAEASKKEDQPSKDNKDDSLKEEDIPF